MTQQTSDFEKNERRSMLRRRRAGGGEGCFISIAQRTESCISGSIDLSTEHMLASSMMLIPMCFGDVPRNHATVCVII
jgi:hypothetical protein